MATCFGLLGLVAVETSFDNLVCSEIGLAQLRFRDSFTMARQHWADITDSPRSNTSEDTVFPTMVVPQVSVPDAELPRRLDRPRPAVQLAVPALLLARAHGGPVLQRSAVAPADLGRWLRRTQVPLPADLRIEVNSFVAWLLELLVPMSCGWAYPMQVQLGLWQRQLRLRLAIYRLDWFQVFAVYGVEL